MTAPAVHPFLMSVLREADRDHLLRLAPEDGEWEEVTRDAATHGVLPLVYRALQRSDLVPALPPWVVDRLRGGAVVVAARNLMLFSELRVILRAFEDRQVSCAPLRGLALAEQLYGDITARPMGDLDLLVQKEDLAHVATILRERGFRAMDRRPGFAEAFSYTLEFLKEPGGSVIVEPHWTITYPPFVDTIDMRAIWRRCTRGRVVGVDTWVLRTEELVLHLCLHVAHRNGAAPLLWLYELDRLLRREAEAFDWQQFVSFARQAKLEPLILRVLRQVQALFVTPVPADVLERSALAPPSSSEGRWVRLLGQQSRVDGKESFLVFFALKGLRAKLRYAFALLFPSPAFMLTHYGLTRRRQLGPAYVRRVCRLSWESLKGVVALLS